MTRTPFDTNVPNDQQSRLHQSRKEIQPMMVAAIDGVKPNWLSIILGTNAPRPATKNAPPVWTMHTNKNVHWVARSFIASGSSRKLCLMVTVSSAKPMKSHHFIPSSWCRSMHCLPVRSVGLVDMSSSSSPSSPLGPSALTEWCLASSASLAAAISLAPVPLRNSFIT